LAPAPDCGDDFVGIGDLLERFGLGVVVFEESIDFGLEVHNGPKDAAFQTTLGENGEEAFDVVEPGGGRLPPTWQGSRRKERSPSRESRTPRAGGHRRHL
jgi:hypothetical protein